MLTCYGHTNRLRRSNLVYLAFRLAAEDTVSDIELQQELDEDQDCPLGFLSEVPLLELVPLQVQVDLLAETWNRHRRNQLIAASLLDAAVVFAAFETAKRIIRDMLQHDILWSPALRGGVLLRSAMRRDKAGRQPKRADPTLAAHQGKVRRAIEAGVAA